MDGTQEIDREDQITDGVTENGKSWLRDLKLRLPLGLADDIISIV
jgi:hypothetical protein